MKKKTGKEQGKTGKIGKKRPPKESQFKPGQSGNPSGRPKGSLNYATVLNRILTTPINAKTLTKLKLAARQKAILQETESVDFQDLYWVSLLHLAMGGNSKAIETIANYAYDKKNINGEIKIIFGEEEADL